MAQFNAGQFMKCTAVVHLDKADKAEEAIISSEEAVLCTKHRRKFMSGHRTTTTTDFGTPSPGIPRL